jgi:hypothetical protein
MLLARAIAISTSPVYVPGLKGMRAAWLATPVAGGSSYCSQSLARMDPPAAAKVAEARGELGCECGRPAVVNRRPQRVAAHATDQAAHAPVQKLLVEQVLRTALVGCRGCRRGATLGHGLANQLKRLLGTRPACRVLLEAGSEQTDQCRAAACFRRQLGVVLQVHGVRGPAIQHVQQGRAKRPDVRLGSGLAIKLLRRHVAKGALASGDSLHRGAAIRHHRAMIQLQRPSREAHHA